MIAAIDLGIPWGEIGRLTPRLILEMQDRRQELERRRAYPTCMLATTYLNVHRKKGRSAVTPEQLFPFLVNVRPGQPRMVRRDDLFAPDRLEAEFHRFGQFVEGRGIGTYVKMHEA